MGDNHLSELCRGSEVGPIQLRLRQMAGDDAADLNGTSDSVTKYVSGIWGFRDSDGRTAFHWAVALRNFDLAKKLMSSPYCSPVLTEDDEGATPFETSCSVGAPEDFVTELLERSAAAYDLFRQCPSLQNRKKETAAGAGVVPPHPSPPDTSAPASVEAGAAVSTASQGDNASSGTAEVKPALSQDALLAILNHTDELGNTALIRAVSRGQRRLLKVLLAKGADLNHQNTSGQTALHRAVSRGDQELVEELVFASEKANAASKVKHRRWMNLQDYRGDSALFYASMENNEELGRFLLHHGADRELRNKEGKQFWEV